MDENKNFAEIPSSFAELTGLKKINLRNTAVQGLPYELQFWTALVELNIKENSQIEEIHSTGPAIISLNENLFGPSHTAGRP